MRRLSDACKRMESVWEIAFGVLFAMLLAPPAAAQGIPFSREATEACLAAAADLAGREACVGSQRDACIETPDGYTTVGNGVLPRRGAATTGTCG